jgi:hypothetical protein
MMTIAPVHPGEVLMSDFLEPLGVTQHRLATSIGVPPRRINEIVHGKRRITADTALRGHGSSGPPIGSGSTSRLDSTSRSRRTISGPSWTASAHSGPLRAWCETCCGGGVGRVGAGMS